MKSKQRRGGMSFISASAIAMLIANMAYSNPLVAQSNSINYAFSGYGTLGYAFLNDENAEYRTGEGISGATDKGSVEVDSRIALQFDAAFGSQFSSSVQLIARQDESGDVGAQVEWGFLRWLPADTVELRFGRMSLPVFSLSDSREVGYANVTLRPPEDVYAQIPLRRFTGADLTVESLVLDSLVSLQLYAGYAREEIFNDLEPDANPILGVSTWVERGPVKARFNFTRTDMDINSRSQSIVRLRQGVNAVLAATPELGPVLNSVRADVSEERSILNFASFGLSAEFSRLFVDIELAQRRADNWVADINSWSIVGGSRFGKYTPYVFASAHEDIQTDRRVALPASPLLDPLEAGINALYEPRTQSTVGLGLRYDLSERIALKSQAELITREVSGISFNRNVDDGSDTGDDVVLMSVVVDFVF